MPLRLTNSLSNRTENFEPLEAGKVMIYCCGVTVYDLCHLGHARSYINWDVLRRYLIWRDYEVTFVQNYTDIDDKILNKANSEGSSMEEVSEKNIKAFETDMARLHILPADKMPRATCCIPGIQTLIEELETKGAAYSSDGDVYFDISKAKNYGQLSGRDPNEQQQGASGRTREGEEERKRHPFDFALWKKTKDDEPGWESPWGRGRPGWHIECSAMVREEFGKTIDIHLGGGDLVFPHHENEIAQSETANEVQLARYWMHNGMVNVGGTKMSKSLGNFTTIRALLDSGVSAMTLRLFVLQAHYRKPLDFTAQALEAASTGWKGLNSAIGLGDRHGETLGWRTMTPLTEGPATHQGTPGEEELKQFEQRFIRAMDDDLNSSGALAVLFDLAKPLRALANRLDRGDGADLASESLEELASRWELLRNLAAVLGLRQEGESSNTAVDDAEIEAAIEARRAAKAARNYAEADGIRDQLKAMGIELIDKTGGLTEWIRR